MPRRGLQIDKGKPVEIDLRVNSRLLPRCKERNWENQKGCFAALKHTAKYCCTHFRRDMNFWCDRLVTESMELQSKSNAEEGKGVLGVIGGEQG